MESNHNILVTGNGFDLYHGRKTGYMDFVRCVEDAFAQSKDRRDPVQTRLTELCNVNGFFRHFHFTMSENLSWTWFEGEMDNIVTALAHFQAVMAENQKNPEYDPASYNIIGGLFSYNDLQIFKHFARIFEQVYDDPSGGLFKLRQQFITPEKRLDAAALVAEARRELDSFTAALDLYLTDCLGEPVGVGEPDICETADAAAGKKQNSELGGKRERNTAKDVFGVWGSDEIRPDYVINFNFTDTAERCGVPEERVFYAKGKAGSEPVNLVLGSPDLAEEPADWIYLRNYFQKLMKFIGQPDRAQLYPIDESGSPVPVTLHYFGYSFPAGDAELLRELDTAAAKTVIYCVDGEDYAYKLIRLIRLFGKDAVMEKIYDGRYSFKIRQY
ncbi:MAG: bacteriophage abortive infection AbiH family protein [Clostridiales bacterium]|nr:bacteriophage abortive infection AbiH family protein [Clostridiales bacterium]